MSTIKCQVSFLQNRVVDITHKAVLEAAAQIVEQDAKIDGYWIDEGGLLCYEEHTSHAYVETAGLATGPQLEAHRVSQYLKRLAKKESN
jgi:hypothetical protein